MEQRKGKSVKRSSLTYVLVFTMQACFLVSFYIQNQVERLLIKDFDKMTHDMVDILSESKMTSSNKSSVPALFNAPNLQELHLYENTLHDSSNSSQIVLPHGIPGSSSLGLPKDFPRWMRRYFNFHAKQRQLLNETNWESQKYLILRCTHEDEKCGGLSDRLKPLPYLLRVAATHKRLFMIRWNTPAKLEEFLLPNKMDWSVPDWMAKKLENNEVSSRTLRTSAKQLYKFRPKHKKAIVVEGKIQDILGGAEYYEKMVDDSNETYETVYHNMFSALFKPSPPIEEMVKAKMQADHLMPGEYSVAHYRAFYGIEDKKQKRKTYNLESLAINAANCASVFRPGGPVYFASDSKVAVDAVKKYADKENRSISVFEGDEALHIDKFGPENPRPPSDFYSVFVDLLLMANGKCVTYGQGGFGRFALLLSQNATCTGRHIYKFKVEECSWIQDSSET
jgi:hypothetical protein